MEFEDSITILRGTLQSLAKTRTAERVGLVVLMVVLLTSCGTVVTTVFDDIFSGERDAAEVAAAPSPPDSPERSQPRDSGQDQGPTAAETFSFGVLASGSQSSIRVPVQVAVADHGAFLDAWAAIHANISDPPPAPDVDFATQTVVIVGLGERKSGGYEVRVESAYQKSGSLVIEIGTIVPGAGDVVASVLTSPYTIVAIAAAGLAVAFVGDDVTRGYDPDL